MSPVHPPPRSTIHTQKGQIVGVSLRIGRYFKGSAGLMDDLLFRVVDDPGKAHISLSPNDVFTRIEGR